MFITYWVILCVWSKSSKISLEQSRFLVLPIVDFIMSSYRSSQSFTWTFKNGKNIYFIFFSYSSRMKQSLWNLKFVFPQEFDFFSWHNISICIHFLEMIGCYIYFKIIHQCITESYLNIFIYLLPLCIGIY